MVEGDFHMAVLNLTELNGEAAVLYKFLKDKIVSQEEAIKEVCNLVQKAFVDLCPEEKPLGIFFFAGPTGTGKTKIVHDIASYFNTKPLIINCGEFQSSYDIAKLVGSPPGYIGHTETKPLFSKERIEQEGKPTVILLDEIEKASPAFFNIMLGIFDKASLSTGDNTNVDFSTSFIFMTSNIGINNIEDKKSKFGFHEMDVTDAHKNSSIQSAMKKKFSPEFLNRLDKTIVFNTLTQDNCRQILDLELFEIQNRMSNSEEKKIMFIISDSAKDQLIKVGYSEEYGARHIKRALETNVVNPLSNALSHPSVDENDIIFIDYINSKFQFDKKTRVMKSGSSRMGFMMQDNIIPIQS